MNAQAINGVYVYFDGDDVGASIELCLIEEDVAGASRVSAHVSEAIEKLRESLEGDFAGRICFAAGDEILAFLPDEPSPERIDDMRVKFRDASGLTVSGGMGKGVREAAGQLRLAKLRGKNRFESEPRV